MYLKTALIARSLCILSASLLSVSIIASPRASAVEFAQTHAPDAGRSERWVRDLPPPVNPASDTLAAAGTSDGNQQMAPLSQGSWTNVYYVTYRNRNWDILGIRGYAGSVDALQGETIAFGPTADLGPKVRPGDGLAAFYSNRSGNYEVYASSWMQHNLEQLTHHPEYDGQPAWSPDGQRLVFVSSRDGNQELYLLEMSTRVLTRLTYSAESDFAPTFSPDGRKLLWVRAVNDTDAMLFQSNTDGSAAISLTPPLRYLQHPAYSPDGAKIAVDADVNADGWNDLAVMNSDGTDFQVMHYAAGLTDLWVGAWASETDLLITVVNYVVYNHTLYIDTLCINPYRPATDSFVQAYCHLDMAPHATVIDITVPDTQVRELPRYARAGEQTVAVNAADYGPAGIKQLNLQWSIGTPLNWADLRIFYTDGGIGSTQYTEQVAFPLGQLLRFRSQGIDDAGHVEPWPAGDGDTWATTYLSDLWGTVADNRGLPVPGALVQTQPVLDDQANADDYGAFHRYVPAAAATATVGKPGFGAVPAVPLDMSQDVRRRWVLPPMADLVINGGIETGRAPWGDDPCVHVSRDDKYNGQQSLVIGLPPLLGDSTTLEGDIFSGGLPQVVFDEEGALHATWWASPPGGGNAHIYYANQPAARNWTAPLQLDAGMSGAMYAPKIDVGADGAVAVAWVEQHTGKNAVYLARRTPEGLWSAVETAVSDIYIWSTLEHAVKIALSGDGAIHLLFGDQMGLHYLNRASDGLWSSPLFLSATGSSAAMDIAANDVLHLVYATDNPPGLIHRTRSPGGAWSTPTALPQSLDGAVQQAVFDGQGTLHVLTDAYQYLTRLSTGEWSPVVSLADPGKTHYSAAMALTGNLPLVVTVTDSGVYYRRHLAAGGWSPWLPIDLQYFECCTVAASPAASVLFYMVGEPAIREEIRSANLALFPDTLACSVGQRVAIPVDMTKTTLSFMNKVVAGENLQYGRFTVSVNGEGVYSTSVAAPAMSVWQHQWLDLSTWAGQTVTVTLSLLNDPRYGYSAVGLDDISIGPWLTPHVDRITPAHVPVNEPFTLALHGENFLDPVHVFLGDLEASTTTWHSETSIEVNFASGAPLGIYHLRVVNATGHESVAGGAVRVGEFVYLPVVSRR